MPTVMRMASCMSARCQPRGFGPCSRKRQRRPPSRPHSGRSDAYRRRPTPFRLHIRSSGDRCSVSRGVDRVAPIGPMRAAGWSRTQLRGLFVGTLGVRGGCKPNSKAVPTGVLSLVKTAFAGGSPDWTRTSHPQVSGFVRRAESGLVCCAQPAWVVNSAPGDRHSLGIARVGTRSLTTQGL